MKCCETERVRLKHVAKLHVIASCVWHSSSDKYIGAVHKLDIAIIALPKELRQSHDERIKRNQPLGELYL